MIKVKILVVHIFLAACYSCSHGIGNVTHNENITVQLKRQKKDIEADFATNNFIPDLTVNSLLKLEDATSLKDFSDQTDIVLFDNVRNSPVAIFSNSEESQFLIAYEYEGDAKNAFACFEILRAKDADGISKLKKTRVRHEWFQTESGLRIGATRQQLILKKGNQFSSKRSKNGLEAITYISNADSPVLKEYHMPGYFMEVTLARDTVTKIVYGFDYP